MLSEGINTRKNIDLDQTHLQNVLDIVKPLSSVQKIQKKIQIHEITKIAQPNKSKQNSSIGSIKQFRSNQNNSKENVHFLKDEYNSNKSEIINNHNLQNSDAQNCGSENEYNGSFQKNQKKIIDVKQYSQFMQQETKRNRGTSSASQDQKVVNQLDLNNLQEFQKDEEIVTIRVIESPNQRQKDNFKNQEPTKNIQVKPTEKKIFDEFNQLQKPDKDIDQRIQDLKSRNNDFINTSQSSYMKKNEYVFQKDFQEQLKREFIQDYKQQVLKNQLKGSKRLNQKNSQNQNGDQYFIKMQNMILNETQIKPKSPHAKIPQQNQTQQDTTLSPRQIQRLYKPTYSFVERFNKSNTTLGQIIQIDEKSGEYKTKTGVQEPCKYGLPINHYVYKSLKSQNKIQNTDYQKPQDYCTHQELYNELQQCQKLKQRRNTQNPFLKNPLQTGNNKDLMEIKDENQTSRGKVQSRYDPKRFNLYIRFQNIKKPSKIVKVSEIIQKTILNDNNQIIKKVNDIKDENLCVFGQTQNKDNIKKIRIIYSNETQKDKEVQLSEAEKAQFNIQRGKNNFSGLSMKSSMTQKTSTQSEKATYFATYFIGLQTPNESSLKNRAIVRGHTPLLKAQKTNQIYKQNLINTISPKYFQLQAQDTSQNKPQQSSAFFNTLLNPSPRSPNVNQEIKDINTVILQSEHGVVQSENNFEMHIQEQTNKNIYNSQNEQKYIQELLKKSLMDVS